MEETVILKPHSLFPNYRGDRTELLPEIRKYYPEGLGESITHYIEPTVGGGAILLDVMANYNVKTAMIGDANPDIALVWRALKEVPETFIQTIHDLEDGYTASNNKLEFGEAVMESYRINVRWERSRGFTAGYLFNGSGRNKCSAAAKFFFLFHLFDEGGYKVSHRSIKCPLSSKLKDPKTLGIDYDNLELVAAMLKDVCIADSRAIIGNDIYACAGDTLVVVDFPEYCTKCKAVIPVSFELRYLNDMVSRMFCANPENIYSDRVLILAEGSKMDEYIQDFSVNADYKVLNQYRRHRSLYSQYLIRAKQN